LSDTNGYRLLLFILCFKKILRTAYALSQKM